MPKISALTSLAQADVVTTTDVLPIVDATAPATTKKVTVQAMVNAGLATLTTLPSGIVNASLNSITPTGGTLTVGGNSVFNGAINATGTITSSNAIETLNSGSLFQYNAGSTTYFGTRNNANNLEVSYNGGAAITRTNSSGFSVTGAFSATAAISSDANINVTRDGSDTIGAGAFTQLRNTAVTRSWATQLSASNNLDWWHLDGGWTKYMTLAPTGLSVTGNVSATGSLQAGAGGDGALSSVRSDNTSAIASGVNLSRGNATGTNVNISTTGDGANGVAAALLRFDGTEVMRWQPGNVAVTGSISASTGGLFGTTSAASGYLVRVGDGGTGATSGAIVLDGSSASNQGSGLAFRRNSVSQGFIGTDSWVASGNSNDISLYASVGNSLKFYANGGLRGTWADAGLSVNGGLNVSNVTGRVDITALVGTNSAFIKLVTDGGQYYVGTENSAGTSFGCTAYAQVTYVPAGRVIQQFVEGTGVITEASAAGFKVTGLTTTDTLRVNVTPTAETPTATHTAVFNINGTNYKFLCLAA